MAERSSAMRGMNRGVNWLLVWIVIALVVGAALIVGVSLAPGYHASLGVPRGAVAAASPGAPLSPAA
jgi:hypothetical protein